MTVARHSPRVSAQFSPLRPIRAGSWTRRSSRSAMVPLGDGRAESGPAQSQSTGIVTRTGRRDEGGVAEPRRRDAMRDVLADLLRWWEAGETVGVGTVIGTFRSAPRPPGAAMLVGPGRHRGRVGVRWLRRGRRLRGGDGGRATAAAPVLHRYGVSDDDAFAVGLTCGGIIDIFIEAISAADLPGVRRRWRRPMVADEPVALATVVAAAGARPVGRHLVIWPDRRGRRRWAATGWTTPCGTTPAACWPPAGPRRSPTARTASAAARGCRCSSPASRPPRGCWCSARSTSPPRSPGWARSSATG